MSRAEYREDEQAQCQSLGNTCEENGLLLKGLEKQPLPGCGYSEGLVYGAAITVEFTLQRLRRLR